MPDPLPSPEVFDLELRTVVVHALKLKATYRQTYIDGLTPSGGSGLSISNGIAKSTEATFSSPHQTAARDRARLAAERLREAAGWIDKANRVLEGGGVVQPEKIHPKAVFSQRDFDQQLHEQRERALRGEG